VISGFPKIAFLKMNIGKSLAARYRIRKKCWNGYQKVKVTLLL
jgi:hypothetical protein